MSAHPNAIPVMRYKDAPKAIEWLCRVFGFTQQLVVPEGENLIAHAQLRTGTGMIMLGSVRDDHFSRYMRVPEDIDGVNTQSVYVVLNEEELEKQYKRAVAAGAEILMPLKEESYGGKNYTCRDLEGHIWSFGSYNPYA